MSKTNWHICDTLNNLEGLDFDSLSDLQGWLEDAELEVKVSKSTNLNEIVGIVEQNEDKYAFSLRCGITEKGQIWVSEVWFTDLNQEEEK